MVVQWAGGGLAFPRPCGLPGLEKPEPSGEGVGALMETMTVASYAALAGLAKRTGAPEQIFAQGRAVPFGGFRARRGSRGAASPSPGSPPGPSSV